MPDPPWFVDIHCHALPAMDDGPDCWAASLALCRMAAAEGIRTLIVTPHQLGAYEHNDAHAVRRRTDQLQGRLDRLGVPLRVLPGGDVRIDADLAARWREGRALTLGDHGKHLLLELPHDLYVPLDAVVDRLGAAGVGIVLSHPERNRGLQRAPDVLPALVRRGCLMQITAGSLTGAFGRRAARLAWRMLDRGLVHFVATDAHDTRVRPPRMREAYELVAQRKGVGAADRLFRANPAAVAAGRPLAVQPVGSPARRPRWPWLRRSAG